MTPAGLRLVTLLIGASLAATTAMAQPLTVTASPAAGGGPFGSSSRLDVAWSAASAPAHHYLVTVADATGRVGADAVADRSASTLSLSGLRAATDYRVTVRACGDAACVITLSTGAASATTEREYWQLVGRGSGVTGLTRIVSDGNARLSATRLGPEAGAMAERIQLYYGPFGAGASPLSTAATDRPVDPAAPDSYLSFVSRGGGTGLRSPDAPTTLVASVATGQGVPLSEALGARVRLFFEARGSDGRTRVMFLDSVDGYTGQDFHPDAPHVCSTAADYSGPCAPRVAIGVEGDATLGNPGLRNARQFKLAWPTLDDWRWDGAPGRFMVVTTDQVAGCSTSPMNQAYAVWDGQEWRVQYDARGCPKLFVSAQAAQPVHVGGERYKMYYGDPSDRDGRDPGSNLPFLGPKRLIYADATAAGDPSRVDFEDWEPQSAARDVVFLWPDGTTLDARAEGYIDDWHFLAPTGAEELQVMYLTITDGAVLPFAAAAVLLNP